MPCRTSGIQSRAIHRYLVLPWWVIVKRSFWTSTLMTVLKSTTMSLGKFKIFVKRFAHSTGSRSPLELYFRFGVSLVLPLAPKALSQVACSNSAVSSPQSAVVCASYRMHFTSLPFVLVVTFWSAIPTLTDCLAALCVMRLLHTTTSTFDSAPSPPPE